MWGLWVFPQIWGLDKFFGGRASAELMKFSASVVNCKILAMRLSLSVNDRHIARASLKAKGWLGAHVSLSQGMESNEPSNRVWISATDTSEEPNAIHSSWESVSLSVGDRIDIEVLPDGDSDAPITVTRSSESPNNLFSDVEQARLMLAAVKICDTELAKVLDRAQGVEPPDELDKIRLAIGTLFVEIDRQLILPTLRGHPELLSDAEEQKLR
jgi:hypothetical protein